MYIFRLKRWCCDLKSILNFFQEALYSFKSIGISDILDILLVAYLIYRLVGLVQTSSAARVAKAIVLLLLITWLTGVVEMHVINFLLNKILELGVIALLILFQPELRRALERFGSKNFKELLGSKTPKTDMEEAILATVRACEVMSRERIGVLLVFEREAGLDDCFKTGTVIDAKVTEQLLRNLFFPKSALHDGAVIIRNGRVAAAGCVMPLSENHQLSSDLGTRHRAAVGTSEVSDAVVVIVSEETGTISVAVGGMLKRHLAPQTLERLLHSELVPVIQEKETALSRIKQFLNKKDHTDAK